MRTFFIIGIAMWMMGFASLGWANGINEVPYSFVSFSQFDLDWYDSADDSSSDKTSLGFSVNLDGHTYTHFDMDSNGYIQLLGSADLPSYYGYGDIVQLMSDDMEDGTVDNTYVLIAYDDLSSYYGFYGYKKYADKIIFYYETETYEDEGHDYFNNFEVILYKNGAIRWNFNYADYDEYSYDLFTGLYLGDSNGFVKIIPAISDDIPERTSYLYGNPVPVPPSVALLATCAGVLVIRRRLVF